MYLFLLFGGIILLYFICYKIGNMDYYGHQHLKRSIALTFEMLSDILSYFCVFAICGILACGIFAAVVRLDAPRQEIHLQEEYEALMFKAENISCRDDFNMNTATIVEDVKEWNQDVLESQKYINNKWIGFMISPAYKNLKTIEYEEIEGLN